MFAGAGQADLIKDLWQEALNREGGNHKGPRRGDMEGGELIQKDLEASRVNISCIIFFLLRFTPAKRASFYQPWFLKEQEYFSSFSRCLMVKEREREGEILCAW